MTDDSDRSFKGFVQWATTPPQAYLVYLIALILVWGAMFYAGTLNPKHTNTTAPSPAVTAPHS